MIISDLQLIELLAEACGPEICFVDQHGSYTYRLVMRDGGISRVDERKGNGAWKTIWFRSASDETIARAAKLIASSTYGKTYPHQGDCSDSDWNGSH